MEKPEASGLGHREGFKRLQQQILLKYSMRNITDALVEKNSQASVPLGGLFRKVGKRGSVLVKNRFPAF